MELTLTIRAGAERLIRSEAERETPPQETGDNYRNSNESYSQYFFCKTADVYLAAGW